MNEVGKAVSAGDHRRDTTNAAPLPSADKHEEHFVPQCFKRRQWLQRPTGAPADHIADPNPATEPKLTRLSVLTLRARPRTIESSD